MNERRFYSRCLWVAGLLLTGSIAYTGWLLWPKVRVEETAVRVATSPLVLKTVERAELPVMVMGVPQTEALSWPASVQQALFDKALAFDSRMRAINTLGPYLGEPEIALLLSYLEMPNPDDGLMANEREGLKNDILNVLRAQSAEVQGLAQSLVAISQDARQSAIMRDYALQHLSEYRERASESDSTLAGRIEAVFWDAAGQRHNTSSGTALLALTRMLEAAPDDPQKRDRLAQMALALARDDSAPVAARMTALSVAGRLGSEDAFDMASAMLVQSDSPAMNLVCLNVLHEGAAKRGTVPEETQRKIQKLLRSENALCRKSAGILKHENK